MDEQYELLESNLHNLYREFGEEKKCAELPFLSAIHNYDSVWPNFIIPAKGFSVSQETFERISKQIGENKWPPYIILQNKDNQTIPSAYGFKLILRWPGMIRKLDSDIEASEVGCLQIKRAINFDDIQSWVNIANEVMFADKKLDAKFFYQKSSSENIELILGLMNGQPAACLLTYKYADSIGFYMVACISAFRKKGIVSNMINLMMQDAYSRNYRYAVLQANKESFKLYQKLCFVEISKFDIYWFKQPFLLS